MIATATELFDGRHYPGVVAVCSDALEDEPECVPLLVLRARARVALRRDLDAQADLRDIIRLDPGCGLAYRLLGELAARQDEHASAAVFFREALRLDPGDREAYDWLMIVSAPSRPAAEGEQLPATAAAAGPLSTPPRGQPRMARGTQAPSVKVAEPVEPVEPVEPTAGVVDPYDPYDERPTQPFPRPAGLAASPTGRARTATVPTVERPIPLVYAEPDQPTVRGDSQLRARRVESQPPTARAESQLPTVRMESQPSIARAAPEPPAARAEPALPTRAAPAGPAGDLPGFGEYLVATGILTRERLRAAQAYQRSMRVQLSTAVVTLGLASAERVAWAAVAHQSRLARERRP